MRPASGTWRAFLIAKQWLCRGRRPEPIFVGYRSVNRFDLGGLQGDNICRAAMFVLACEALWPQRFHDTATLLDEGFPYFD